MGDLSKNFSRWEFACPCGCGFNTADVKLVEILQWLADELLLAVNISESGGGCRCLEYNRSIGSSDNSQHPKARAADIVLNATPEVVYETLDNSPYADEIGLGIYDGHVHVDSRGHRARWDSRKSKPAG